MSLVLAQLSAMGWGPELAQLVIRGVLRRWLSARALMLAHPHMVRPMLCGLAAVCLWAIGRRAGAARAAGNGQQAAELLKWPTRLAATPVKIWASPLRACADASAEDSVRTIDLYDDEADEPARHGTPAPTLELRDETGIDSPAPSPGVLAAWDAGATDGGADTAADDDLPTPSTAQLLSRLQAPRRFKASTWQPSARTSTTNSDAANDAQSVVAEQAEQQRAAAAAAKQKRDEKRAQSGPLSLRSRALLEARQSCEVYSTSSKRWLTGTIVAADEVLPNTVKVGRCTSAP
jgi:hypothetical protein